MQGNADCAASAISLSPANGPEGTVVTVTGGTDFGGLTTASFNGLTVSVTVISSTEIEVVVPSATTTGSLEVDDDMGCLSSELFTVIDNKISSCEGNSGTIPLELFISEITDKGSGSHTYIEIYNGTGSSVALDAYKIEVYNNGNASSSCSQSLSGTIANDEVKVIAIGGTDASTPEGGYTADFVFTTCFGINEDDNIRLYNGATWVDLWGDTSGSTFTVSSKDYTYRRKNSGITAPSITWNANDWYAFTPVDYSDIGLYDFSTGTPPIVNSGATLTSSCNSATISVTATEGNAGGNPLTYQWYFSMPGDSGWSILINDAAYNGVTLATLNVLDTSTLEGYQNYCQIREDDFSCYSASDAVQITVPLTTWNGSAWDNGTPNLGTIVVINGDYDTSVGGVQDSFSACNLIVNAGNELNVRNSTSVKVQNNVVVDGTITVQTQGAFVQVDDNGTFANAGSGTSKVLKTTATFDSDISTYNYTYWSSPVINANVISTFPNPVGNRRYYFKAENYLDKFAETGNNNATVLGQDDIDDNGDDWQIASSIMAVGKGYAVTAVSGPPMPGLYSDTTAFIGEFNTGDILVSVYKDDSEVADNNWNFIGNPYPSAIDA